MKKIIYVAILACAFAICTFAQSAVVTADEMKVLEGELWTGNLTYLDYGSGKKTSIRSNLKVTAAPAASGAWTFDYIYPDEPKANGKSAVKLSSDGSLFNDQTVIEKAKLGDGTLKLVTTKTGTDNNKKALFRYTYLIGQSKFSLLKEVKADGTEAFFERNTYTWTR